MTDTAIDELLKKIEQLEKHNEELQCLDGLQQMTIERLNKEISRLRESLFLLEDQYKRSLISNS
jgi:predicted nuclease with TOPRIM domain